MPTVLEQILTWSERRPAWQRDALRRLATAENPDREIDHFHAACISAHGLGPAPALESLSQDHIATAVATDPAVRITSISGLKNVNALEDDQALTLAADGVTLIYGGNGTGKSGFMRVVKQVCRARGGAPRVHPNVFQERSGEPTARITYLVGDEERSCQWTEEATTPPELSAVSAFDSLAAGVYVTESNELEYIPSGLDLLQHLSSICDQVRQRIDHQQEIVRQPTPGLPEVTRPSELGTLLDTLGTDGAFEKVGAFVTLVPTDISRLAHLNGLKAQYDADNPRERAKELDSQAVRLDAAKQRFDAATVILSDEAIAAFRVAEASLVVAERAATMASKLVFSDEPLDGVGTDEWRALWTAARAYARQHAYPDAPFPSAEADHCPLCQQTLESGAADRFTRFESFVTDSTRAHADATRVKRDAARDALASVKLGQIISAELTDELAGLDAEAAGALETAVGSLRRRARGATSKESGVWAELPPIPTFPIPIVALAKERKIRAVELRRADDVESRRVMERERLALDERRLTAKAMPQVKAEHERRARLAGLDAARRDTSTQGLTLLVKSLTASAATEHMIARFAEELDALGLKSVDARMESTPARKGKAYHQLALPLADDATAGVDEILSEGERRCAALAALLAELSLQMSASTLILDDPCSSLDHVRRERMAERLAAIAVARPVVILTHDVVFAHAVQKYAGRNGTPVCERRLRKVNGVGRVEEGLGWAASGVEARVRELRARLVIVRKQHQRDPEAYNEAAADWYGHLRETWELAVPAILLNGAVTSFGREVHTRPLRGIWNVTEDLVQRLDAGMTEASLWMRGHNMPAGDASDRPDPDTLSQHLADLDTWINDVKAAREGK